MKVRIFNDRYVGKIHIENSVINMSPSKWDGTGFLNGVNVLDREGYLNTSFVGGKSISNFNSNDNNFVLDSVRFSVKGAAGLRKASFQSSEFIIGIQNMYSFGYNDNEDIPIAHLHYGLVQRAMGVIELDEFIPMNTLFKPLPPTMRRFESGSQFYKDTIRRSLFITGYPLSIKFDSEQLDPALDAREVALLVECDVLVEG